MKLDDYKKAIDMIPKNKNLEAKTISAIKSKQKSSHESFIKTAVCVCSVVLCAAAVVATVWYNVSKLNSEGGIVQSPTTTTVQSVTEVQSEINTNTSLTTTTDKTYGYIRIGNDIFESVPDGNATDDEYILYGEVISDTFGLDEMQKYMTDLSISENLSEYIGGNVFISADGQRAYIEHNGKQICFIYYSSVEYFTTDSVTLDNEDDIETRIYRFSDNENVACLSLYDLDYKIVTALSEEWSATDENVSDYSYIMVINHGGEREFRFFNKCGFIADESYCGNKLIDSYWNHSDNVYLSSYSKLYSELSDAYELVELKDYAEAVEIYRADSDDKVMRVMITEPAEIDDFLNRMDSFATEQYSDEGSIAYFASVRYVDDNGQYYFENTFYGNDIFIGGVDYYGNAEIAKYFNTKKAYECGSIDYNLSLQIQKDASIQSLDNPDCYYIKQFLDAFMLGNTEKMAALTGAQSLNCFDSFDNIKLDSYAIKDAVKDDYTVSCIVELNIAESDNGKFPIGKSLWVAMGPDGVMASISKFIPYDNQEETPINENQDLINFCEKFSTQLGITETCSDFNTHLNSIYSAHSIIHLIDGIFPKTGRLPYDEAVSFLEAHYGIEYPELKQTEFYDASDNTLVMCSGHGGKWLYSDCKGVAASDDRTFVVTMDYYADACKLVVARTVEYRVEMLDNEYEFKLLSTECTYDSGYSVLLGSV